MNAHFSQLSDSPRQDAVLGDRMFVAMRRLELCCCCSSPAMRGCC